MADGIEGAHDHFVLDISYDFYGERMATCSQDKYVRIWERVDDGPGAAGGDGGRAATSSSSSSSSSSSAGGGGGRWRKTGETQLDFVPHRVTWAHPE